MAGFFAAEADLDLVSFASPFPLPALLDGVDLPLFPAFEAALLADELPPGPDLAPVPALLLAEVFLLPAEDVPLLPPVVVSRLAVDAEAVEVFLVPPAELLLAAEPLVLLVEAADLVFADPLLLLAEEALDLLPPPLFELPLLLAAPDADFFVPPAGPLLLDAVFLPAVFLLDAPLAVELFGVLLFDVLLFDLPLDEPLLEPVERELSPPMIAEVDGPPTAFFIADADAPTTAPVAAPVTMSPITSAALLPTRSFAFS